MKMNNNNNTENYMEKITNEIDDFVLDNTFDDIKRSKHFYDILNKWDGFGFLDGINGEIKNNLAIAYAQMAAFLMHDGLPSDKILTLFDGEFETAIFPIIRMLYTSLPLSDYDYSEILKGLEEIELDDFDNDTIQNAEDSEAMKFGVIGKKLIELIKNK